jgi:hypothetical protein
LQFQELPLHVQLHKQWVVAVRRDDGKMLKRPFFRGQRGRSYNDITSLTVHRLRGTDIAGMRLIFPFSMLTLVSHSVGEFNGISQSDSSFTCESIIYCTSDLTVISTKITNVRYTAYI